MKILSLKYKLHKLVNLVFYLIVFGLGFLLGFLGNKINFDDLLSNFLFIDKVYAEELVCTESKNLFNEDNYTQSSGFTIKNILEVGKTYKISFNNFNDSTYGFLIKSTPGAPSTEYDFGLFTKTPFTFEYTQAMYDNDYKFYIIDIVHYSSITKEEVKSLNLQLTYEICVEKEEEKEILIGIVNDSFYNFSKKIIGDLGEENYFVYDFITLGLISVCFIFFVLLVGYIIKKFFGG